MRAFSVLMTVAIVTTSAIARPSNYSDSVTVPQIGGSNLKPTASGRADQGQESYNNELSQVESLFKNASKAKEAVYNNAWSGTRKDLEAIVAKAEEMYGFENSKNLGRNATMLIPATLGEMRKEIDMGNVGEWNSEWLDGYHDPAHNPRNGDGMGEAVRLSIMENNVLKFTNPNGGEVCYNAVTGKIVKDEKMGTKNLEPHYYLHPLNHNDLDVKPHGLERDANDGFSKDGDQYKYVGILYERDPDNPDKYYIIDGQTGLPMDAKQVAGFPTTLSDMWKDMGLSCVTNDAEDIVPPREDSQQDAANGKSQQHDLHSLDLDDPNGDWCKCESPGCVEHVGRDSCGKVQGYVTIQCSKCGKINVEYARKALSFESQAESQGVDTTWTGNRSDAVKAAQGK